MGCFKSDKQRRGFFANMNTPISKTDKFQDKMNQKRENSKLTECEKNKYKLIMDAIRMGDDAQQLENNGEEEEARKLKSESNRILDGFDEKEVKEYQKSYYEDKEIRIKKQMEEHEKQQQEINEQNRIFREKQDAQQKIVDDAKKEKEKYLTKYLDTFNNPMKKGREREILKNKHERMEELNKRVVKLEEGKQSAVQYNRVKYNRMDYEQQKKYDQRMNETKPEYKAYTSENSWVDVTKSEYEYLKFLQSQK